VDVIPRDGLIASIEPPWYLDPPLPNPWRGLEKPGLQGWSGALAGDLPRVHSELQLLLSLAGFTPMQAITAGTLNGAKAIGIDDRVGSIEVGKRADLLLLRSDPTEDIGNTRKIEHVFLGGRLVR
jgi:predicted amidohydrolase YtcJ